MNANLMNELNGIADQFSKDHDVEIIKLYFDIYNDTDIEMSQIEKLNTVTPAACLLIPNEESLKAARAGLLNEMDYPFEEAASEDLSYVIVVNMWFFEMYEHDQAIELLNLSLNHEYGHIQTINQIPKNLMESRLLLLKVISKLSAAFIGELSKEMNPENIFNIQNMILNLQIDYLMQEVERLANDYAGINPQNLAELMVMGKMTSRREMINSNVIDNFQPSDSLKKSIQMDTLYKDLGESAKMSHEMFTYLNQVIVDPELKDYALNEYTF